MADEYADKRGEAVDTSGWPRLFPKDIPQQRNGCDCGVFTLKFADYVGRGAPMGAWAQADMPRFRVSVLRQLLALRIGLSEL